VQPLVPQKPRETYGLAFYVQNSFLARGQVIKRFVSVENEFEALLPAEKS
jgi:hypothetical protein